LEKAGIKVELERNEKTEWIKFGIIFALAILLRFFLDWCGWF
jgi:hypothetical protein